MIREFQRDDINKVADIWLDTNIKAHNFIPAEYWKSNFKSVKEALTVFFKIHVAVQFIDSFIIQPQRFL